MTIKTQQHINLILLVKMLNREESYIQEDTTSLDIKGLIIECVPEGQTINQEYYLEVLTML
jgi:hypothetical protein